MNESAKLADFFDSLDGISASKSLNHGLHPYPAKFIPQIPRALIESFSQRGEIVLDPMCGSGTTLVEAIVMKRPAIGNDINPISAMITRAKTTPLNDPEVAELVRLAGRVEREDLDDAAVAPEFLNREHWFSAPATSALAKIRSAIEELDSPAAADLARTAFSAIVVGVSNQDSETRWVRTERKISEASVFQKFARHLRDDLDQNTLLADKKPARASVYLGDARSLPVPDESVRLVVTSPPYANSHDYYLYNKLRMFWLGLDVAATQEAEFGSRNKHSDRKLGIEHYLDAMAGVLAESARVVVPGGHVCIVVGDAVVRGEFFDMGDLIPAISSPLLLNAKYRFDQQKFTRAFTRGFGTKLPKSTHVLIFEKP